MQPDRRPALLAGGRRKKLLVNPVTRKTGFNRPYQYIDNFAEDLDRLDFWPAEMAPPSTAFRERAVSANSLRILAGREWDQKYQRYLRRQLGFFYYGGLGAINCEARLEALGRLAHAWQDFYAHAIRIDQGGPSKPNAAKTGPRAGRLGSEQSEWPGWAAFRAGVRGTPDVHPNLMPSSYLPTSFLEAATAKEHGEHPNMSEPLIATGFEYKDRIAAAQTYTNVKVIELLEIWYQDCVRHCPPANRPPPGYA